MKYEYKVWLQPRETQNLGGEKYSKALINQLNELGEEGWEYTDRDGGFIIFQRERK